MAYGIKLKVWGERACFTRPEMKAERVSYDVITPSAARGILEAIHWKPAILWHIDKIHVLKPVRFETIRRNELGSKLSRGKVKSAMKVGSTSGLVHYINEDRQQRATTLLRDVAYVIEAHFTLTAKAGADDDVGKHLGIFNRRARTGQHFHAPCMGNREFTAHFELIEHDQPIPESELTGEQDLGWMLHDFDYQRGHEPRYFRAIMKSGQIEVPTLGASEVKS